jgi:uncharacterized membrane protein
MKLSKTGSTLAIAVAALVTTAPIVMPGPAHAADVKCFGINECKGHGSNTCRGQGVVTTSEAECKAKGGKIVS